MSNKQFISNLSATYADVRKLDVKKINLKGKNILEYIKENSTNILDERGTKADDTLDIWNSYVTKDEDGNVIINRNAKPFKHGVKQRYETGVEAIYEGITQSQVNTLKTAVKVIDNEVLGANDAHIMYWQTDGLTDGYYIYSYNNDISEFKSDLSSLTNAYGMFAWCNNLTTFSSDLSNLTNGRSMFNNCPNLTTFTSDLPSLTNGHLMFHSCDVLTSFTSDLSSLTDGLSMFQYCSKLESFSSDLSSLTSGMGMFNSCTSLKDFNSDLSSLSNGSYMFYNTDIAEWNTDLPSLTNGSGMFYFGGLITNADVAKGLITFNAKMPNLTNGDDMFNGCKNLTSFTSDLSSLTYGVYMFLGCFELTTFNGDLSSLTDGRFMFYGCKLDAPSVANIIHFIPQRDAKPTSTENEEGNITIGIGITFTDAARQAFAEECDCDTWDELMKEFDDKNWVVQWQFNGDASTFDLRGERPSTAVYAKLEEVIMPTEEEIAAAKEKGERIQTPHYEYVSQDGDNYYNIHWYHDSNTNNEGYDYFESLEMATLAYSVIPKA